MIEIGVNRMCVYFLLYRDGYKALVKRPNAGRGARARLLTLLLSGSSEVSGPLTSQFFNQLHGLCLCDFVKADPGFFAGKFHGLQNFRIQTGLNVSVQILG